MENKVSFKVFIWAIGIIMTVMSLILSSHVNTNKKVDAVKNDLADIRVDISAMRTDISWIKTTIADNKNITFK